MDFENFVSESNHRFCEPSCESLSLISGKLLHVRKSPSFCLGKGLFMAINLGSESTEGDTSVWQPEILLYEVIFLAIESVLYLILAVQIDRFHNNPELSMRWGTFVRRISFGLFNSSKINITNSIPDDDDVVAEQDRVSTGEACTDQVVVDRLTKIWPNGTIAVDKLTLGIPGGEVFGLLGINGTVQIWTANFVTAYFGDAFRSPNYFFFRIHYRCGQDHNLGHVDNGISTDGW